MLDSSLNFLKPYEADDLIRVGRNQDGGYIVPKNILNKSNFLLSFGMANDWSFEEDFLKYNSINKVHIYDHSVNYSYFLLRFYKSIKRFFYLKSSLKNIYIKFKELTNFVRIDNKKLIHFKKKVDLSSDKNSSSIDDIFSSLKRDNIIVKIDIEGDEYKILNNVLNFSNRINALIIEFHEIDKKRNEFLSLIKEIQKNYYIIHLHGNNITGYCRDNLPKTIEFTFIKINSKDSMSLKKNKNYPIKNLDFANHPYMEDIQINFAD